MATRQETVKVQAEIEGYRRAMRELDRSTAQAATAIDRHGNKITGTGARMVRSAEVNREAWTTAGTTLTAFGAAGVAALGLSAKAAIDWESAWTGVLKTVDGTPEQLAALEDGLREMALRLPASAEEIAGVAEAAGQLGVKVDDVQSFTETMINLGETTNLTADEAATALARIANIMGTTVSDVSRMGATIVDLGNNAATTEAEIVALGTRLAAAGSQAGLSEADVLAFASALTSVGVEAEAGGTAMSKVFTAIGDAVRDGGEELSIFADVAGVSVEEFRRAFEEDAAGAIGMFVEGMGRASQAGESTTAIFEDLELTDERLKRSILSLGSATGLLGDQLETANSAWESNTALVEEAEKRYDTTEAKIQIAKNSLNEAAIVIGENLLPMLAGLAEGVADVTQWFAGLPDPVQKVISGVGGIASVASLAAGGFLLLFPRVVETQRAFRNLSASNSRLASGLGKVGKAAGIAAAAMAAVKVAAELIDTDDVASVSEYTAAILELADGTEHLDSIISNSRGMQSRSQGLSELGAAIKEADPGALNDKFGSLFGTIGLNPYQDAKDDVEAYDQALTALVQQGALEEAAEGAAYFAQEAEAQGKSVDDIKALLPGYNDALIDLENQSTLAGDATDSLATSTGDLAEETKSYTELLTEQIDLQREAAGVALDEFDALTRYAEAVTTATDALYDENEELIKGAATLDAHTEAGRANRDALSDLATSTWTWVEAGVSAGVSTDELTSRMNEGRDAFIRAAQEMGATKGEAEALADSMGLIPSNVSTAVQVTGLDTAIQKLQYLSTQMNGIDGRYVVAGVSARGGSTFASGGAVYGPGTSTSDSIPAWLSDGKYVQNARAHQFWGTQAMHAMNNRDVAGLMQAMDARGFAGGGSVSYAAPSINVSPVVDMSSTAMPKGGDVRVYVELDGQQVAKAIRVNDRKVS